MKNKNVFNSHKEWNRAILKEEQKLEKARQEKKTKKKKGDK